MSLNDLPQPKCPLCEYRDHWLGDHVLACHGLTVKAYEARFPHDPLTSLLLMERYAAETAGTRRKAPGDPGAPIRTPKVDIAGVEFTVNLNVPQDACLILPAAYAVPKHGPLAEDVQEAAIALSRGRSLWIHGPPGCGKDAMVHAVCALTRRPSKSFTISPTADVHAWMYTREVSPDKGTSWKPGELLCALRDGYLGTDGVRVPYLVLLSDFDRATRAQAEILRKVLDSIQGRLTGPNGEEWPVFPGTTLVATANSSGGGDPSGRCISAAPVDASLMDRVNRFVLFHYPDPADEEPILREKCPTLASRYPEVFPLLMACTRALRDACAHGDLYFDFSHRTLVDWALAAQDRLSALAYKGKGDALVAKAFRTVLDKAPNDTVREALRRTVDPHLPKGVI